MTTTADPMNATSATETLARFTVDANLDRAPQLLRPRIRALLLDHIGITAFAADHADSSPAVRAAVDRLDSQEGQATVIGVGRAYSPPYAAFLNGVHAHSMDMDDTNRTQTGHPGVAVFPSAIAEAERLDANGEAFLDAVAVGYEVCCRIGAALTARSYDRGFHITSVSGIFGAVAAVSRLRGLDAETTLSAFGLALSKASGSMQYLSNGAWNKRLHPGFIAQDAHTCVTLAESGVLGADAPLEGRYGLLTGYTDQAKPTALTENLGTTWVALDTAVKPYPSCRLTHGAIDAAIELREALPAEDRSKAVLKIKLPSTAMTIVGEPGPAKLRPRSIVDAQFSVYFQVACAWLDGQVTWTCYERLADPELTSTIDRISVSVDDGIPNGGATLTVHADGRLSTRAVPVPLGEPENWIGDDMLGDKFRSLAEPVFGAGQTAEIAKDVLGLGSQTRMRQFVRSLAKRKG